MVKIELLIPLAYLGIICTSSTESAKIAHFVFFFFLAFLLLTVPSAWSGGLSRLGLTKKAIQYAKK